MSDRKDKPDYVHYTAETVPWRDSPLQPGAQMAVLAGELRAPGLYIQRVKYPKGAMTPAHYHPDDRHVVVLAGTWYAGFGDTSDPAKAMALNPATTSCSAQASCISTAHSTKTASCRSRATARPASRSSRSRDKCQDFLNVRLT